MVLEELEPTIKNLSKSISEEYEYALSYFYDKMEVIGSEDLIKKINKTLNLLCKRIRPIINEIKSKKNT